MDYFRRLEQLLQLEKEEDRRSFREMVAKVSVQERRENGFSWYPVAIRDTETGRGDYLTVELERTTHQDIVHQLRFGMTAALFSNHDPAADRIEGTISHISGNRLKLSLRTDELPEWSRRGKLGIDAVFDEYSYREMEQALKRAPAVAEKREEGGLVRVLTGAAELSPDEKLQYVESPGLNTKQNEAVNRILQANELAIVHGPPGTGKTTTLVQAIKALIAKDRQQVLVTAPSNAAVDLLAEKLSDEGLNVVRVGNPARVNEKQMSLTLDSKVSAHASSKEIRRLKKQANEYRDLAQKYKRSFGAAERQQRNALFAEARSIREQVEKMEQYIVDDIISRADVVAATLVGANHYTIRDLRFGTAVIDEAAQALEPACWIPVLKAKKLVIAGDHFQLPPTIKSAEAAKELGTTLLEKLVQLHPQAVVLLQEQYRMHQTIMGFSSREFYNNQLIAHPSVAERLIKAGDSPFLFIDTAGCGFEEKQEGTGISNPEEASFLLNLIIRDAADFADSAIGTFPTIAVIAPYRHQVELLKDYVAAAKNLETFQADISVNTIDSFQGQERDAVYISLTRSNADNTIGFLSEVRRINVAMTRAKKKLVVVGDGSTLAQYRFYDDLIGYAQSQDAYRSAWEFM
ncbi:MAG TPA: AAA domain-containing protein [Chitinophagaceae bacterium]